MSNEPTSSIEEKYGEKLTPVVYAKKQIGDMLISFGSLIAGAYLGSLLGTKVDSKNAIPTKSMPFGLEKAMPAQAHVKGALIGAVLGGMIGGIIQGFSRWRKHESERLSVAEINEDVANMKIRNRTDPELVKENARLREMLEEQEKKTAQMQSVASKIVEHGPKPHGHKEENHSVQHSR